MSNNFSNNIEKYINETDGITTVKTILGSIICLSIFYKLKNIYTKKQLLKNTSDSHQITYNTTPKPIGQIETTWEIVNPPNIS